MPNPVQDNKFLIANGLGCSSRTVRRLAARGLIPGAHRTRPKAGYATEKSEPAIGGESERDLGTAATDLQSFDPDDPAAVAALGGPHLKPWVEPSIPSKTTPWIFGDVSPENIALTKLRVKFYRYRRDARHADPATYLFDSIREFLLLKHNLLEDEIRSPPIIRTPAGITERPEHRDKREAFEEDFNRFIGDPSSEETKSIAALIDRQYLKAEINSAALRLAARQAKIDADHLSDEMGISTRTLYRRYPKLVRQALREARRATAPGAATAQREEYDLAVSEDETLQSDPDFSYSGEQADEFLRDVSELSSRESFSEMNRDKDAPFESLCDAVRKCLAAGVDPRREESKGKKSGRMVVGRYLQEIAGTHSASVSEYFDLRSYNDAVNYVLEKS